MQNHPLYAVIDLGSNSFHMLITRLVADSVQVVDKVKRKVRLASGLDENNLLNDEAIDRGLECLSFFAERLQDIPPANIRIVATATLRIATNADIFLKKANDILGQPVNLLTGEQEAQYIYLGVAHTSCCALKRLVLDIGGASTEMVVGNDFKAEFVHSLDIGCVTFLKRYFANGELNQANFANAKQAAVEAIQPLVENYQQFGWQSVLGGSGTMQALAEVLLHRHQPSIIDGALLEEMQEKLIACQTIEQINIGGLQSDRKPVFASGIAILQALFECFEITKLQLSSGAIREGLLYEMLPDMRQRSIEERTVTSLREKFHIEVAHADRVEQMTLSLCNLWQLPNNRGLSLLTTACALHEIGLLLEFKRHQQHGQYILNNADLPGFSQADRQLLAAFVRLYKADIEPELLVEQSATDYQNATHLLAAMRIAVILCRRRQDDELPAFKGNLSEGIISLSLPKAWLKKHPLISDELKQEQQHLKILNIDLQLIAF